VTVNEDTFARMVAEEVKNKLSPTHKKILLDKQNWPLWQKTLVSLSENLEEQLVDIKSDMDVDRDRFEAMGSSAKKLLSESNSAYLSKMTKIERFKFHVDKRLDEVSLMLETGEEITSDGWKEVDFFRRAIGTHRALIRECDLEDTVIDKALWATLDNKWLFNDIDIDSL